MMESLQYAPDKHMNEQFMSDTADKLTSIASTMEQMLEDIDG